MTNEKIMEMFKENANNLYFGKIAENTIELYTTCIKYFINSINNKSIIDANEADIKKYLISLGNKSASYYNCNLDAIKKLFKMLCEYEIVSYNIADKFDTVKVKKDLTKESEKVTIDLDKQKQMIELANNARMKAILSLEFNTGLRVSELCALTLDQYLNRNKEDGNRIDLLVTKGSKGRSIYLNQNVVDLIDEYLLERKDGCDNLFVSNQGTPMERTNLSKIYKRLAKKVGYTDDEVNKIGTHTMRRSMATTKLNQGVSIDVISKILGHSSVATTGIYAKTSDERMKMAMGC